MNCLFHKISLLNSQHCIKVRTEQCGQTNPLMFSTMPRILNPVFLQKVISRLTSPVDTACKQKSFAWLQVLKYFIAFNVYNRNAKSFIVIIHYIQYNCKNRMDGQSWALWLSSPHSYFQCYLIVGGFSRLLGTWGVVTKMAPSTLVCFLRFSSTAKCSSDVPGGVSTSSTSSSPHATSDTNWPIKAEG